MKTWIEYVGDFNVSINALTPFNLKKLKSIEKKSKKNFIQWVPFIQAKMEGQLPTAEVIVSNISNRITLFHNGQRLNGWDLYMLYRNNFIGYKAKKESPIVNNWINDHRYMNLIVKHLLSRTDDYRNQIENHCPLLAYLKELLVLYGDDRIPRHIQEHKQCHGCQNADAICFIEDSPEFIAACTSLHFKLTQKLGKNPLNKEFFRILKQKKDDLIYEMYPTLKCTCSN